MLPESYDKIHRKAEYILEKLKYLRINKPYDLEIFADDEIMKNISCVINDLIEFTPNK